MDGPNIKNTLIDQNAGVTYDVMAYRALSEQEVIFAVRMFLSQKRQKKLKRGSKVTIISVIGAMD